MKLNNLDIGHDQVHYGFTRKSLKVAINIGAMGRRSSDSLPPTLF